MESVCSICVGEISHHPHDANLMLRAHCIARQFYEYWLDSQLPMMEEAKFINTQCQAFLEINDNVLQNMCIQFQESGEVSGYRLFKLSQCVFQDKVNWGRIISIFAFATKLMSRENSDLIIQWLTHVLFMNTIWV